MITTRTVVTLIAWLALAVRPSYADSGILLLAHGGSVEWNARVTELAARVGMHKPTEVAFGMASRTTIQAAVDRLAARGVTEIVAVPLFVSSWSSVIASTEYLLGARADAPPALAAYARMEHGQPTGVGADAHGTHAPSNGTTPVVSALPIRMTPALNDHPIVADILVSRARAISQSPTTEAVVLVAHGPNEDDDNRRWLADLASLASRMKATERFASIDYLTVRDDAPKAVRDRATAELRDLVERRSREGRRVLIVPVLVSFGGIDRGVRERLQGLTYVMSDTGLVPDDRLVSWVLAMSTAR